MVCHHVLQSQDGGILHSSHHAHLTLEIKYCRAEHRFRELGCTSTPASDFAHACSCNSLQCGAAPG